MLIKPVRINNPQVSSSTLSIIVVLFLVHLLLSYYFFFLLLIATEHPNKISDGTCLRAGGAQLNRFILFLNNRWVCTSY